MSNTPICMSTVRQILRLLARKKSMQAIIEMTDVSRNTLRKYQARFHESGLSIEELLNLSDKDLHNRFQRAPEQAPNARIQDLYALMPRFEKELKRRGVTRELLWHEYRQKHPDGFERSQFKRHISIWLKQAQPVMHIEHKAGDKMYVDFTGGKLSVTDPANGVVRDVEVFVAILGASQLIYVEAVDSQNKADFIYACRHAVEYYGGSPDAIVPDNLRAAVTKSSKFEPTINSGFEDFASHYGMTVLPARAYRPRDKALVEGAVKIVYRRIFSRLRDQVFTSLHELNIAVFQSLDELNAAAFKGRTYSRRQLFEEIERESLAPLPDIRYELREELRATVMRNGHVCLSTDKHYYSVPHRHIGHKVKLLFTRSTVDIYHHHECIASHTRSKRPYGYTTDPDHLASTHRFVTEWSAEKFLAWAQGIGTEVHAYIEELFRLTPHPEQAYRMCLGILNYAPRVGHARLIKACQRATEFGVFNYSAIRNILERGLEHQPTDDDKPGSIPDHDNIRGSDSYDNDDDTSTDPPTDPQEVR